MGIARTDHHGLSRVVPRSYCYAPRLMAPFGWTYRRSYLRPVDYLVPIWLAAALRVWDRRWFFQQLALRWGFFQVPTEAAYYHEGHWTLKPWESYDLMRSWSSYYAAAPAFPGERFARWLQRVHNDMPRWA